jgi:hypothetical protein
VKRSVVVVGGGIMGCACAWELARLGLSVILFERSVPGAEASSAAAGILGASVEYADDGPLARLARASRRLYPSFVRDLQRRTGIDPEYRECGVLEVDFRKRPAREAARRRRRSPPRLLDGRALRRLEPALSDRIVTGVLHPRDARVNPRLLLRALRIAAARDGVVFRTGAYVRRVVMKGNRAGGIARQPDQPEEGVDLVLLPLDRTRQLQAVEEQRARPRMPSHRALDARAHPQRLESRGELTGAGEEGRRLLGVFRGLAQPRRVSAVARASQAGTGLGQLELESGLQGQGARRGREVRLEAHAARQGGELDDQFTATACPQVGVHASVAGLDHLAPQGVELLLVEQAGRTLRGVEGQVVPGHGAHVAAIVGDAQMLGRGAQSFGRALVAGAPRSQESEEAAQVLVTTLRAALRTGTGLWIGK